MLLRDLAAIYTDATGRAAKIVVRSQGQAKPGQPTGRVFNFLRAAVAPVPALKGLGGHALAGAAKLATKDKKATIAR